MNKQQLLQFIDTTWDKDVIPTLCDYIKIPNKSPYFDPQWIEHGHMDRVVNLFYQWCQQRAVPNMKIEIVRLEKRTPLIYINIPGDQKETVLLYGHLDKQPEMTGWDEGLGP